MSAFCRKLDNGPKRRHCRIFKPGVYDELSTSGAQGRTSKCGEEYTQGIDIYQNEMILVLISIDKVPIWIDKHWSRIAIDTVKNQIQILDTIYDRGSEILRRIK